MNFIKKQWSNILFGVFIVLMIVPQTRMPIQVFIQRFISFSPSEIAKEDRATLKDYNWNLAKLNSERINLSQSEGKVILINFWATWCPPCIAEMPELQELYNEYGDKVDFYFITNEKPETVNLFLEKKGFNLPIFLQIEKSPEVLESSSLPTTYLISKSGEIIMRKTGAASWNSDSVHEVLNGLLRDL
ncbi:MAG: redoxin domain-containing protein [Flavobacteriaceae bacterium]